MPLTTSAPNTIHTFSTEMIEDLSPREVERRFREADRTTELGSRVRAFYASDMRRRRTYKAMGYKRFAEALTAFLKDEFKVSRSFIRPIKYTDRS